MRCIVDEEGRPAAKTYRWMRGNHVQPEVHSSNLTIFPVSLETRANFSCEGTYALYNHTGWHNYNETVFFETS